MAKIFINYRTSDGTFAAAMIEEALTAAYGPESVFRDSNAIPVGVDFRKVLWQALARSDAMIVVIGRTWLAVDDEGHRRIDAIDDYVREEIALGLKIGFLIVPVLVDGASMPAVDDLPYHIRDLVSRQYVRLNGRTPREDLATLVRKLTAQLNPVAPPVAPQATADPGHTVVLVGTETGGPPSPTQLIGLVGDALAEIGYAGMAPMFDAQPDALLVRLPAAAVVAVGTGLVGALSRRIDHEVMWQQLRPHLRIALAYGPEGPSVARQLIAPPVLGLSLASTGASVILVASDEFFQRGIRNQRGVDASTFLAADLGDGVSGWVHIPGRPVPPALTPRGVDRRVAPARRPRDRDASVFKIGTVNGDVFDGDKTVYNIGRDAQ